MRSDEKFRLTALPILPTPRHILPNLVSLEHEISLLSTIRGWEAVTVNFRWDTGKRHNITYFISARVCLSHFLEFRFVFESVLPLLL